MKRRNELFEEAMDQFSKLAKVSLEALKPFANHRGNCSTACASCRLKRYYKKVSCLITEVKP